MTLTRRLMWPVAILLSKLAMCSCGGAPPGASAAPVQRQNTVKDGRPQVPHPNTTVPAEIIANIAAVARQTSLGQPFQMDALKEADVKLRARPVREQ